MPGPKRRPLQRRQLPRLTAEAIAAFRDGDGSRLHLALNLAPWEMSPLRIADNEREPDVFNCTANNEIWLRSWWQAKSLRAELQTALSLESTNEIATEQKRN